MVMTPIFLDGCSHYDAASILQKWDSGSATMSSTVRHGSGQSISAPSSLRKNFSASQEVVASFAFRISSLVGNQTVCQLFDSTTSTVQFSIILTNATGVLRFARGTTVLIGSSGPAIAVDTWYYVEVGCLVDNSAGAFDVVVHDGTTVLGSIAATGIDTQNTATATVDGLIFSNANLFVSDVHLLTGSGYDVADFYGDSKIVTLYPDAAGSASAWTIGGTTPAATNFESVGEDLADELMTAVETRTANNRDFHQHDDLDPTVATVNVVAHTMQVRKDDTATRGLKHSYRSGGATVSDGSEVVLGDWEFVQRIMEQNPVTAAAWARAEVMPPATWGYVLST